MSAATDLHVEVEKPNVNVNDLGGKRTPPAGDTCSDPLTEEWQIAVARSKAETAAWGPPSPF